MGVHFCPEAIAPGGSILDEACGVGANDRIPLSLAHTLAVALEYGCSDIFHPLEEAYAQAGRRKFLCPCHCPIAVLEVVVFYTAEFLNGAVAAMVIGEEQAFIGHYFSRASASEKHNCILQGCLIDAVNIFG